MCLLRVLHHVSCRMGDMTSLPSICLLCAGGFWRVEDRAFVTLDRIQFVGACNPPTDPGRVVLTERCALVVSLALDCQKKFLSGTAVSVKQYLGCM